MITFVLSLGATSAYPQASSSMAELRGQVTDSTGALVPNATVTLTDTARGTSRTVTTDGSGQFTFLAVPPSDYELKVEAAAANFAAASTRVTLTVGQQANIPVQLTAAGVTETVSVVAGAEVVETDRTQQSSVIDDRQITNLPISRRNYLDYALLTPGVNDSDNIADSSDFRVAQTPQSGLSFGGNNGRGNYVSVDGMETTGTSGGVIPTVSQEAVQEFQVLRNSFNAEFGSSSGGIVNIVTKTGSNRLSGSAFGLFRDDRFDARNAFDFMPNDQLFENQAAGALTAVSRGRTGDFFNANVLLSETHQFSANTVNEVKAQFLWVCQLFTPNDPIGPEFNIEGFCNFGRDIFLPGRNIERHYDVIDNVTRVMGNHTVKFGGSFSAIDVSSVNETFFGGRFNLGTAIPLSNIIALNPAVGPTVLTQLTQFLTANNPSLLPTLSAPINALQSFNLNLPIVYQQGLGEPGADSWTMRTGFYGQDTWKCGRT
ncbi:MAG TPA: TonB-dependent receptor [Pyrinomonadaceae bacterium]|nr:TonB-dependent receptor [Pyrinomonadaceae bacterium]